MRWMFWLITAVGSGTAVMQFCERIGMNVWLSRGIGAVVAGIAGVVIYNWIFGEKGNQR